MIEFLAVKPGRILFKIPSIEIEILFSRIDSRFQDHSFTCLSATQRPSCNLATEYLTFDCWASLLASYTQPFPASDFYR